MAVTARVDLWWGRIPMRWTLVGMAWSVVSLVVATVEDVRDPKAIHGVWAVFALVYGTLVYVRTVQMLIRTWSTRNARPVGSIDSRPAYAIDAMLSINIATAGLWMAMYLFDAAANGTSHFAGLPTEREAFIATWYRLLSSAISLATTPGTIVIPSSLIALTVYNVHCLLGIVVVFGVLSPSIFDRHDDDLETRVANKNAIGRTDQCRV